MRGAPIGALRNVYLAPEGATSHGLVLRDRRGRLLALDLYERRLRRVSAIPTRVPGCRLTDARRHLDLVVCGRTIQTVSNGAVGQKPRRRVVARAPGRVGHWVRAEFAPRGDAFLAQWSAECEVPVAFLVVGARMRPYGGRSFRGAPSSEVPGWLRDGSAVIHFPEGACGGAYRVPGVYVVPLLRRSPRFSSFGMWGG